MGMSMFMGMILDGYDRSLLDMKWMNEKTPMEGEREHARERTRNGTREEGGLGFSNKKNGKN